MHFKIKTLHLIHSFTSALVFLPNMDSLVDGNSFLAVKYIALTLFLGIVFQETLAQRCMFLISSESHPTNLLTIYGCINYCLFNIFISLLTFYSPHLVDALREPGCPGGFIQLKEVWLSPYCTFSQLRFLLKTLSGIYFTTWSAQKII